MNHFYRDVFLPEAEVARENGLQLRFINAETVLMYCKIDEENCKKEVLEVKFAEANDRYRIEDMGTHSGTLNHASYTGLSCPKVTFDDEYTRGVPHEFQVVLNHLKDAYEHSQHLDNKGFEEESEEEMAM